MSVSANKSPTASKTGELAILAVVIAMIISLFLPFAISIAQKRDEQIKDLLNGKRIAVSLRQFAVDHDGAFPNRGPAADYAVADDLTSANKSNDAFWWLFPTYLTNEEIFTVPGSAWSPTPPDSKLDAAGSAERTETLRQGECAYLYVTGLADTSNPEFPLLADAGTAEDVTVYTKLHNEKGGIWRGKRAILVFVDGSGGIVRVDDQTKPTAAFVKRSGRLHNIFDTTASTSDDPWLSAGNIVLAPD